MSGHAYISKFKIYLLCKDGTWPTESFSPCGGCGGGGGCG